MQDPFLALAIPGGYPAADDGMVGGSERLGELRRQIQRVAGSDVPVCLLGESGSGKEGIARRVHTASGRSGAFVAVNAGALRDDVQGISVSSELPVWADAGAIFDDGFEATTRRP